MKRKVSKRYLRRIIREERQRVLVEKRQSRARKRIRTRRVIREVLLRESGIVPDTNRSNPGQVDIMVTVPAKVKGSPVLSKKDLTAEGSLSAVATWLEDFSRKFHGAVERDDSLSKDDKAEGQVLIINVKGDSQASANKWAKAGIKALKQRGFDAEADFPEDKPKGKNPMKQSEEGAARAKFGDQKVDRFGHAVKDWNRELPGIVRSAYQGGKTGDGTYIKGDNDSQSGGWKPSKEQIDVWVNSLEPYQLQKKGMKELVAKVRKQFGI